MSEVTSSVNYTIVREENELSLTLNSTAHALLGGVSIMISVIASLLNLLLARLLSKDFSFEESNGYTKLLLALVSADTVEMAVVGIPVGVNLWQEGRALLNDSLCALSGGVHFICDKGSVLILLVLGFVRLRAMRKSVPPSKSDEVVSRLSGAIFVVVLILTGLSYTLIPFPNLEYTYSERYYFCMWGEVKVGEESWRSLTHELYWALGFLAPHLAMSGVIALLTWHCVGYVSDPDTCKSQVFLQAVRQGDGGQQDTGPHRSGRQSVRMLEYVYRTQPSSDDTPTSIRSCKTPTNSTSRSPNQGTSAAEETERVAVTGARTPNLSKTNFIPRTPGSIRTNFIPPAQKQDDTSSKARKLNPSPPSTSTGVSRSTGTSQLKSRVFDTEEMEGRRIRSKSRGSDESLQLRLSVLNRKRFIEGHKTVCLLLVVHTVLNLPRWITLMLEFLLRLGFQRYANGLLVLLCAILSTFLRCALTTGVLWWRIISVRHIIGEP